MFVRFGIPKFRIVDLHGEELKGTFYEPELQRVNYSEDHQFEVEEHLDSRMVGRGRNRRRQILVKWKGWPPKFNSWVDEDEIQE